MPSIGDPRSPRPYRFTLALIGACLALLALAPLADAFTGAITGTVTEAGSATPLSGIGVEAYQPGHESTEGDEGFATTEPSGKYTIPELAPGNYTVEFYPKYNSHTNVLAQYYNEKTLQQVPDPVSVSEGFTKSAINAKLLPGATFSGKVIDATHHEPIAGVFVLAEKTTGSAAEEGYWEYTETDSSGNYQLTGLPTGEYVIRFEPESFFFEQNYLGQSYKGGEALKIKVEETRSSINAELVEGGEISGTVTDAVSHAGLSEIGVGAYNQGAGIGGGTYTRANGEYTIVGLPTGTYKVLFEQEVGETLELKYLPQYFTLASSLAAATPIAVTQGSVTSSINAALLRTVPVLVTAPVLSGTAALAQTLSCSSGSWTGSPTLAYAYIWRRDGSAIAGSEGSSYVVQAADQGHALACEVTATNKYGRASSTSNSLVVSLSAVVPTPAPLVPQLVLPLHSKLKVRGGVARIHVACKIAACKGVLELVEQITVKRHGPHGTKTHKQTVVLAKATYGLAAGHSAAIVLHLTMAGRRALAKARHHQLTATLLASLTGATRSRGSAVLTLAAPKRH